METRTLSVPRIRVNNIWGWEDDLKKTQRKSKRKKHTEKPNASALSPKRTFGLGLDEKYTDLFYILVLAAFGAYLVILYYGHQAVPNSDFPAFFKTGQDIVSFHLPGSFKRVPGLGVSQVLLSYLMPGPHPGLTAGYVLNSGLYVGTGIFLYLIGKRLLGSAAVWFSLIVLINPMALKWMRHPIAETILVFFIVATFYLMLRGTKWMYVMAMLTTMMRYEGAVLVLLCFCIDFFSCKNWKGRLFSFLRAGLSALPLALWIFGLVATRAPGTAPTSIPYVRNYAVGRKIVIGKFSNIIWDNGIRPLLMFPNQEGMQTIWLVGKICLVAGIVLALIFCIAKKQWRTLLFLGFFGMFYGLHATRTYTFPRYAVPAIWVTVLVVWYGFKSVSDLVLEKKWLPPWVQIIIQLVVAAIALIWVCSLFKFLPPMAPMSRQSSSVPYITILAVFIVLLGRLFVFGRVDLKKIVSSVMILSIMALMIVSNQFMLTQKVGNGTMDKEFKYLAQWYHENGGDDILATTLPHVVRLYVPEKAKTLKRIQKISGNTPQEVIKNSFDRNIKYLCWDSRLGFSTKNVYYKRYRMERFGFLANPNNFKKPIRTPDGIITFEKQIRCEDYRNRFINIYKLEKLPALQKPSP